MAPTEAGGRRPHSRRLPCCRFVSSSIHVAGPGAHGRRRDGACPLACRPAPSTVPWPSGSAPLIRLRSFSSSCHDLCFAAVTFCQPRFGQSEFGRLINLSITRGGLHFDFGTYTSHLYQNSRGVMIVFLLTKRMIG